MSKYLWKSMKSDLTSGYDNKKWKIGKWYKIEGALRMCNNGFHASENITNSMQYVSLVNLAKVEVRGNHLEQSDKQCWKEMRIIKAWKWTKKDSVALAIYAAKLVLKNFEKEYPDDKRPRDAIKATKNWLKNPTKKNQTAAKSAESAARSAAWSAWSAAWSAEAAAESAAWSAWSAAWSARSAAETAARSVAESAVWSAAETAARSAESAARSAESAAWSAAESAAWSAEAVKIIQKCHNWIKRRIPKLEEIK